MGSGSGFRVGVGFRDGRLDRDKVSDSRSGWGSGSSFRVRIVVKVGFQGRVEVGFRDKDRG